ncbi:cation efflux protein [Tilletiaria anomala UBC 951]|uniref:Cation efflux protein n=1 Tax=Tilletiaria anomala (strain ATCC 24038 / CBS 436.72 / UBC 951) TaxID=1037660 RepID=A0A066W9L4_TILAU|nr:cation efflux protein [Tilletiaria anomala UBC 951]KDN47764.1 cation efflux protein [Tilletiaria anomala UBC 951]
MGFTLGREGRLILLLIIDIAFFFVEIITGYAVGSLALVADSFHMLNDVISLIVAFYALKARDSSRLVFPKLSKRKSTTEDPRYSYGWQRAEVLGALINGVFLLALCFSIFMEAIERFINVQEVQNPKLVIIVGSLGLASNIVGLFLFHDHGHAHGHAHGGHSHGHVTPNGTAVAAIEVSGSLTGTLRDDLAADAPTQPAEAVPIVCAPRKGSPEDVLRRSREDSVGSLYGHPAHTRALVVQAAHDMGYDTREGAIQIGGGERDRIPASEFEARVSRSRHSNASQGRSEYDLEAEGEIMGESSTKKKAGILQRLRSKKAAEDHTQEHSHEDGHAHDAHEHAHQHSHGHSHDSHRHGHGAQDGSMNMQGVFLHVLGDALGNVGVIGAGIIILKASGTWRFYMDPLISFIITIIIFHSALPLVKSASFILLQGVPPTVPLETVKQSMLNVDGVLSVHELHIWQLSESKIVASVHVLVDCSSGQMDRYVEIAGKMRRVLHSWGIHSSTIQPEFVRGGMLEAAKLSGVAVAGDGVDAQGRLVTENGELVQDQLAKNGIGCLLACDLDASCAEAACCPPQPMPSNSTNTAAQAVATEETVAQQD